MVLDNDSRGWIMSCVSGIGRSLHTIILCFHYSSSNADSLHIGFQYYMCRLDCTADTGKAELQDPG